LQKRQRNVQRNASAPNTKRSKLKLKPKPVPKQKRNVNSRRENKEFHLHLTHPAHRTLERNNDDAVDEAILHATENTANMVSQAVAGESNVANC
jgi:hypothetical protein